MKILMVCLGNICRSPLAEGIMRRKALEHQLADWYIDSAGTGDWHVGELPDSRSIATAKRHGIDITDQRARQFKAKDLSQFDLVLAMDRSNYKDILSLATTPEERTKVKLILEVAEPGAVTDVPDPYWDDDGFEQVYSLLDEACEKIISAICAQA